MLGRAEKRVFLNISGGKVVRQTDRGQEKYDFVEGLLVRVYSREREFRGEKVPYWYLDLKDQRSGDLYTLGIRASSGVWRSLILSLGSEDFTPILPVRIVPYKKGEYDRVSVYSGDTKLDWVSDLPPVEEIEVAGEKVRSVAKREAFIADVVDKVNGKLK